MMDSGDISGQEPTPSEIEGASEEIPLPPEENDEGLYEDPLMNAAEPAKEIPLPPEEEPELPPESPDMANDDLDTASEIAASQFRPELSEPVSETSEASEEEEPLPAEEPEAFFDEPELPPESPDMANDDLDTASEIAASQFRPELSEPVSETSEASEEEEPLPAEDLEALPDEPAAPVDRTDVPLSVSAEELETITDDDTALIDQAAEEAEARNAHAMTNDEIVNIESQEERDPEEFSDTLPETAAEKQIEDEELRESRESSAPHEADVPVPENENTALIDNYAEETAEELEQPVPLGVITDVETQEERDPPEPSDMLPPTGTFLFFGESGVSSFSGNKDRSTVFLSNDNGHFNDLSGWYLVVSTLSQTQDKNTVLPDGLFCQGIVTTQDGTSHVFSNQENLPAWAEDGKQPPFSLVLNSLDVVSLAGRAGTALELDGANGILIGPNKARLIFSGVEKIIIPAPAEPETHVYVQPEPEEPVDADSFTFTLEDASRGAQETTDASHIVIKAGYSLYGWNVAFENGQTMSLADVRLYRSKHHELPDSAGVITYRQGSLSFTGAQSIKAYEKPSYCGYGLPPVSI
ncbi:MAG: hypothetical protein ACI4PW_02480 [Alphaproteobacteria bacterium]